MEIQKKVSYTTFGDNKGKQYSSIPEPCDNPCEFDFCESKAMGKGCREIPTCKAYKTAKRLDNVVVIGTKETDREG
jgi:hypothetical protein